jgi:dTDP-glucose pyrophosphorylase
MAGAGSRFSKAGYRDPKPLIQIHGLPMISLVIANLKPTCPHRFIFICQRSHLEAYDLKNKLKEWASNCEIIAIDGITAGAACTVLASSDLIDNDNPLMVANSDQYVDININHYLTQMDSENLDGLIMTMTADDPKWSFVGLNEQGLVSRVVEKEVISDEATVGIYNFRHGADFVWGARESIRREIRVNGEFYVAPVYNLLIEQQQCVGVYNIGKDRAGMYGLGIPEDLISFEQMPLSKIVTKVNK